MRRTRYSATVVVMVAALMVLPGISQDQPPKADDEWQQEQWDNSGLGQGTAGGMGGMGGGMMPPDFARGPLDVQQRIAEMQRRMEQMQREAEARRNQAIRELLGVSDEQWLRIKPRLDRIEQLREEADAAMDPGSLAGGSSTFFNNGQSFGAQWSVGFSGGGMGGGGAGGPGQNRSWQKSWSSGTPQARRSGQTTQGDVLCQDLLSLLQNPNTPTLQISQKVMALRQAKERARVQLAQERTQLRRQINPHQEAALILLGYLD